jgi:hypothetical protein
MRKCFIAFDISSHIYPSDIATITKLLTCSPQHIFISTVTASVNAEELPDATATGL